MKIIKYLFFFFYFSVHSFAADSRHNLWTKFSIQAPAPIDYYKYQLSSYNKSYVEITVSNAREKYWGKFEYDATHHAFSLTDSNKTHNFAIQNLVTINKFGINATNIRALMAKKQFAEISYKNFSMPKEIPENFRNPQQFELCVEKLKIISDLKEIMTGNELWNKTAERNEILGYNDELNGAIFVMLINKDELTGAESCRRNFSTTVLKYLGCHNREIVYGKAIRGNNDIVCFIGKRKKILKNKLTPIEESKSTIKRARTKKILDNNEPNKKPKKAMNYDYYHIFEGDFIIFHSHSQKRKSSFNNLCVLFLSVNNIDLSAQPYKIEMKELIFFVSSMFFKCKKPSLADGRYIISIQIDDDQYESVGDILIIDNNDRIAKIIRKVAISGDENEVEGLDENFLNMIAAGEEFFPIN